MTDKPESKPPYPSSDRGPQKTFFDTTHFQSKALRNLSPEMKRMLWDADERAAAIDLDRQLQSQEAENQAPHLKPWDGDPDPIVGQCEAHNLLIGVLETLYAKPPWPIRWYREEFWIWEAATNCYNRCLPGEVESLLLRGLEQYKVRLQTMNSSSSLPQTQEVLKDYLFRSPAIREMVQWLKVDVHVPSQVEMPCWVHPTQPNEAWSVPNTFSFQDQSVDLEDLTSENPYYTDRPATSQLFTDLAVGYPLGALRQSKPVRWQSFLDEMLPDPELQQLLQMWFGYCLVNDNRYHRFMLLCGPTATGKSTTANVLKALLGTQSVSSIPLTRFGDTFALQATLGKKLNLDADMAHLDRVEEETLRSWVGGDAITINRKFKSALSIHPKTRLMFCTNQLPIIRDRSDATYRRMLLVPFDIQIPADRRDTSLLDKLTNELPAIWWWAHDGLQLLRERGDFPAPASMAAQLATYKESMNPVLEWFNHYGTINPAASIPISIAYARFQIWAEEQGDKFIPSSQKFSRTLLHLFPGQITRERRRIPVTEGGGREYAYFGFHLEDTP